MQAEDLNLLGQYDPTICNVIELFDVRPRNTGYMDGSIRACFAEMPPVLGYASTATILTAAVSDGVGGIAVNPRDLMHADAGSKDIRQYSESRLECLHAIADLGARVRARRARA